LISGGALPQTPLGVLTLPKPQLDFRGLLLRGERGRRGRKNGEGKKGRRERVSRIVIPQPWHL